MKGEEVINMNITPGNQTSEFYVTLITMVVGILVSKGVIEPSQASILTQQFVVIVGGIMTIVPAIIYIINRTWLKSKVLKAPPVASTPDSGTPITTP